MSSSPANGELGESPTARSGEKTASTSAAAKVARMHRSMEGECKNIAVLLYGYLVVLMSVLTWKCTRPQQNYCRRTTASNATTPRMETLESAAIVSDCE